MCFLFDARRIEHDRLCVLRGNALLKRALLANPPGDAPDTQGAPGDPGFCDTRGGDGGDGGGGGDDGGNRGGDDGLAPAWGDAFTRRAVSSGPMSSYRRSLLDAAATSYRDAIQLGAAERAEWAHVGLGQALLELSEVEGAIAALQVALLLSPTNAHVLSTLSSALRRAGRLEAAYAAAAAAVLADPTSAAAHNNCGLLLVALGRQAAALDAFVAGLRVDAEDTELLVNTGVSAAELGHTATAVALFTKAIERAPGHVAARRNLELLT